MATPTLDAGVKRLFICAAALSAALLAVRLYAATRVGFGDSEALYACYALEPQPAYLDHPGLIGVFARAIGGGLAPSPRAAHELTSVVATAVPWLVAFAARAAGAGWRGALGAAIAVAIVPEIAIGLFAMTPDLLLSVAWLGALGLAAAGLRAPVHSTRAAAYLVGAGLLAGVGASAKVSGLALVLALAATYLTRGARPHARSVWPWAGIVAGLLVLVPVVSFEARGGWPMVTHRLVDTQQDAGFSLRNVAALPVGQLAYLSPLFAIFAVLAIRDLFKARRDRDARASEGAAVTNLLLFACVIPLALFVPLALWSRVAEPHWLAPAFLSLPIHWARGTPEQRARWRGFRIACVATALVIVSGVYAWVLVPSLPGLVPSSAYDARYDIANELYGWPEAVKKVRELAVSEAVPGYVQGDIVVVGPHWTVCAQLHAALERSLPVGCATTIKDDFDTWYPRATWREASTILLVTDNRFDVEPTDIVPTHVVKRSERVTVFRGGRAARVFTVTVLSKRAAG